jgi:hypothetical protein
MTWSFLKKEKMWAGGVAQVVEYLLSKWEALSSNNYHHKNQNKTGKKAIISVSEF